MGGGVSTNHKSSNRIELSRLRQDLFNFWGGGGERVPPTHIHTHTHMHACTCAYDIIGNSQGLPQWGGHLHEIIMFNMHACACAHVWGAPPTPIHPPHPQSHREPKT